MPVQWPALRPIYIAIEVRADDVLPPPDAGTQPAFWKDLLQRYPNLKPRPLFTSISRDRIRWLHEEARRRDPDYQAKYADKDLSKHYALMWPSGHDYKSDLAQLKADAANPQFKIRSVRLVVAGGDPGPSSAPNPQPPQNSSTNPDCAYSTLKGGQVYRRATPEGIDADGVIGTTGADGHGIRFGDVERGWTVDHADLEAHGIDEPLHGTNEDKSRSHGTSVLGIVSAVDDETFCTGIAPKP